MAALFLMKSAESQVICDSHETGVFFQNIYFLSIHFLEIVISIEYI
jgi:hypothetical protein